MSVPAPLPPDDQVRCPLCRQWIPLASISTSSEYRCVHCGRAYETVRFDPPIRFHRPAELEATGPEGAQPCATHPGNAAVANCERCGAFMCELCRIEVDQRVLCPSCFERLAAEGALESARTRFRDFEGLSSMMATAGCLFFMFFSVLFGPLAIYFGIRGLRQKKRMGETEGRVGIWVAILLGTAELVLGLFMIVSLVFGLGMPLFS